MSLTKLHKILKKYKELHKGHIDSWEYACKRIRLSTKDGEFPDETYRHESYNYQSRGNRLLDSLMKEIEGVEVFPKKK